MEIGNLMFLAWIFGLVGFAGILGLWFYIELQSTLGVCVESVPACYKYQGSSGIFSHVSKIEIDCDSPVVEIKENKCLEYKWGDD